MLRFVLLTCWLIGAGGGWGLGLAGLNAMGTGAGSFAELIVLGGASSWAAMLVTALRPGKRPNLWQRIFTVLAWLMPVGMFMLGDVFNLNVRLFAILAAACVTMIVVIYPSQSPQPRLDEGRRLALHLREQEAKQKRRTQGGEERSADDPGGLDPDAVRSASTQAPPARTPREESPEPDTPRPGWAPQATPPGPPSRVEDQDESSSRWQTPQVRRRGKLRDVPAGESRAAPEGRRR